MHARYYAEVKGWQVSEIYRLEAVSGKSVMEHPEAKRMMRDIERGHIRALIFSKLARLARNTKELLDFADFFRSHEADLVSLQESIDTSKPCRQVLLIDDRSPENIKKFEYAKSHFERLNSWLTDKGSTVRYQFNMLSPKSYSVFFQKFREESLSDFRSELDAALTKALKTSS